VRAAITWAIEAGDADLAARLAIALWRFWQMRGYLDEGQDRLKAVLAMPECADYAKERLAALDAAGGVPVGDHDLRPLILISAAFTAFAFVLVPLLRLGDKRQGDPWQA